MYISLCIYESMMPAPRRCTPLYMVIEYLFSLCLFPCFLDVISISLCLLSSSLTFDASVLLSLTLSLALSHSRLLSLAVSRSLILSIVLPCSFTCSLSLSGPLLSLACVHSLPLSLCLFLHILYLHLTIETSGCILCFRGRPQAQK